MGCPSFCVDGTIVQQGMHFTLRSMFNLLTISENLLF
jgi:hypothetical protein